MKWFLLSVGTLLLVALVVVVVAFVFIQINIDTNVETPSSTITSTATNSPAIFSSENVKVQPSDMDENDLFKP